MTDAPTIHRIRPAEQSCLSGTAPLPPRTPSSYLTLFNCAGLRVDAYKLVPARSIVLHLITDETTVEIVVHDLPAADMGKLVTAFADGDTRREPEGE